jgi:hypothetical protein
MIQNKGSLSEKFAHCAKYALGCAVIAGEVVFKVTKSTAKIAVAGVFGYVGGLYGVTPMFAASPYGMPPDPELSSLCMGGLFALITALNETKNSRQWLGIKFAEAKNTVKPQSLAPRYRYGESPNNKNSIKCVIGKHKRLRTMILKK